jgi:hypothetical protein
MRSPQEQTDFLEHGRFGKRKRRFTGKALAILIAIVVVAGSFDIYGADEGAGGFVIWNQSEAYLFAQIDLRGSHASLLKFPWILLKEFLVVGIPPNETRAFLVVIRVTSSSIERHVVNLADRSDGGAGSDPSRFTPIGDHIYADCPSLGGLCRWAGDRFEPATHEERSDISPDRYSPQSRLSTDDFENDRNGWSRRGFVAGPVDRSFSVEIGNQFRLLLNNVGEKGTKNGVVSISIVRPSETPQRVATFKTYEGLLGSGAYWHIFRDPIAAQ